jgi:hypothetical protein
MIQNQKEFKIQTYNVSWSVPILNALFIQNHVIILPLNNHLLTCHLTSTPHLSLPPHRKELESWGFHQGHCIIHIILHQRCHVKKCLTCGPFPKMTNVQVAFGIFIHCFMQCPSYFLKYTLPSSTFIESFISFYSSFFQMFGCFLGPRSLDSPKGPLACEQAFLQIAFGGIGPIRHPPSPW